MTDNTARVNVQKYAVYVITRLQLLWTRSAWRCMNFLAVIMPYGYEILILDSSTG